MSQCHMRVPIPEFLVGETNVLDKTLQYFGYFGCDCTFTKKRLRAYKANIFFFVRRRT